MSLEWLAGISFAAICGLIGIIYAAMRARQDRQDGRLEHHIDEDVKVHERVAIIESKVGRIESEHQGISDRLHNHGHDIQRLLGRLFKDDQK